MLIESVLNCPHCSNQSAEIMPTDAGPTSFFLVHRDVLDYEASLWVGVRQPSMV